AFVGLDKVVDSRNGNKNIGFGWKSGENSERLYSELMRDLQPDDLIKYGLIPEFAGRLPVVAVLDPLTEEALCNILTKPKNAIVAQFKQLFKMDGIDLTVTDGAVSAISKKAFALKTGARGLRTIVEKSILETMYFVPSDTDIREVIISDRTINDNIQPEIVRKSA
ncbi:MAG: ATP-dependent Clp protease ATP-binding subunit ClpX, partial [Christensenellaceae bacterium]|nr:ATP-dependent Clp protease ATP-binding subunit ClpX [Christensenellaceae bacterium]